MVNLGFISSSEQCPPHVRHVRILAGREHFSGAGQAEVRILTDAQGRTSWALDWLVAAPGDVAAWSKLMAIQMNNLAWPAWWLDVGSLLQTTSLPADSALARWGNPFWGAYLGDALVFLDVGGRRRMVYQVVRQWEARMPHMRFSTKHDLDATT
ncbi:hypothetical protein SAMN05660653_02422 [Desulfonatronum thiosulfatophilum]|uniref:Uncharacterized protein n=1 Tax=Desulfonatronum thiosulfatophilum TaxID=617002 RepID=A0A1G6DWH0_9BACT|nr:hypothetical protein [Desulfonatronum thiosulfatophilum]SDB49537.1 hypothetical protein SAMN05660653_02422 [Desulfonatronum thiosulfatophilum]